MRYADDMFAFVMRSAGNLRAFFALCDFCGLGSGTTNNVAQSFVEFTGVDREGDTWAPASEIGVAFVPDGSTMTVTGLEVGYNVRLQDTVWKAKIARVLRSLRSWMRVELSQDDRVLIFRAVGMSVWAFGAGPVPPTAAQKKKMAAIRRRFVLSGKVPAGDGEAAFTTHSKVSGDELARPVANGGSSLPTIGHWLDELNVARVLRLLDPVEQTQKWTYFVLHWAAERIGVWGARAATGPAPNKATLAVSQFLTRYKEATNVLTSSKYMPAHWQARFRSFFRAMQRTMIMPIVGTAEARSEPLWHNSLLQTGRGVWDSNPATARTEGVWKKWAQAGICTVADITEKNGDFRGYNLLVAMRRLDFRSCTQGEYDTLTKRVAQSRVGDALLHGPGPASQWFVEAKANRIWLHEEGEWFLYRPQTADRFWLDGDFRQAVSVANAGAGTLAVKWSLRSDTTLVDEDRRVCLEQWSAAQFEFIERAMEPPPAEAIRPCVAQHQETKAHNALIAPAQWQGETAEWASAALSSIMWTAPTGKVSRSRAAVLNALREVHVPAKRHLAHRTWEQQGGPKPRWARLFTAPADMSLTPWVREGAWKILQGAVWWGSDRLDWEPETSVCPYCRDKGRVCIETAAHFANCPRWDLLWRASEMVMETAGLAPVVRTWFVLYGPEATDCRRDRYDTVVWIWAAVVTVMLRARREAIEKKRNLRTAHQLVTQFRGILFRATTAEFAAATTWKAPFQSHAGRWGRRQARTMAEWRRRWRGIAQRQGHRMVWFDNADFDEGEAARMMAAHWEPGDAWTRHP